MLKPLHPSPCVCHKQPHLYVCQKRHGAVGPESLPIASTQTHGSKWLINVWMKFKFVLIGTCGSTQHCLLCKFFMFTMFILHVYMVYLILHVYYVHFTLFNFLWCHSKTSLSVPNKRRRHICQIVSNNIVNVYRMFYEEFGLDMHCDPHSIIHTFHCLICTGLP